MTQLTCFKAYDIRGKLGVDIDESVACHAARPTIQYFEAKSVVIDFDASETSPAFTAAAGRGLMNAGPDVLSS